MEKIMKQEDKQLLLKDICARIPYGVKGLHRGQVHELFTIDCREAKNACLQVDGYDAWFLIETFKPYLRPMSSMTEEELSEYRGTCRYWNIRGTVIYENKDSSFDWLNAHHFDYRGLIPMGLALEAPEGMYKTE